LKLYLIATVEEWLYILKSDNPMKKIILLSLLVMTLLLSKSYAQDAERYGKTLNLGLGIGYYGYINHSVPVLHFNYELDVAKNFTLAPFISFYSYHYDYYWGNPNKPYKYYTYRSTVIPLGVKGTYYFDSLLEADPKWDFYLAASLGVNLYRERWSEGYGGDRGLYKTSSPLYIDLHAGTEYHINQRVGLFLDLSTGVSTIGLSIHAKN
jgi:hypothetical protein